MSIKISFCTVCMNRLHHVKQTLPRNISDNLNYSDVEFILLDYNSSDGLEQWVKEELGQYLASGVLKYYRTEEYNYFNRSHSRNMMFQLAEGDVLCNVDADNYTGSGFAAYIADEFSKDQNIYIVADTKKRFYFLRNAFGRFCMKKDDFLKTRGLDEEMISYGSETVDLYERLEQLGLKEIVIQDTRFLNAISHGDEERISNEFFLQSVEKFYLRFISHQESEFIILYQDKSFESGYLVPERIETHLPAALMDNTITKGDWKQERNELHLIASGNYRKLLVEDQTMTEGDHTYYLMSDPQFLLGVAKNYSFITNVQKKKENILSENIIVNPNSFGNGKVFNSKREELYIN